ncbi:acyl-CoA dehydrogenase family protein [Nocardia fluminea]|uniref:acyl-CoA dehydrogenase family protein n=1 Tax=Nocardia fluminea TaxID=134984 RepID=UPI0036725E6D
MSDHNALQDLVADVLDSASAPDELCAKFDELGLFAVGIDENRGGSGGSLRDLAAIVEAVGFAAGSVPIVEFAVARWILAATPDRGVGHGAATAVLVDASAADVAAGPLTVSSVAGARAVDTVILWTNDGGAVALSTAGDGVVVEAGEDLAGFASDTVSASAEAARLVLDHSLDSHSVADRFALLRAAALTGAVRGAYALTRDYVRTREQFGAPLVKLPAVASGIATMRTKVLETSAALSAALAIGDGAEVDGTTSVLAARIVASRCASDAARMAHQLHGAMGTTMEYPLHGLTKALWTWRDADLPESEWSRRLGERVVRDGEPSAWRETEGSSS